MKILYLLKYAEARTSTSMGTALTKSLPFSSLVAQLVKNPPAMQETQVSIPGLGRSLGVGNVNLLHYSCLENPMDKGVRQDTVHRVPKSQIQLSVRAHTHIQTHVNYTQKGKEETNMVESEQHQQF